MEVIEFYKGKIPANGKKDYLFRNIVFDWTDGKLEAEHDYIQWLFPDNTGGVANGPKINWEIIKIFRTDQNLRRRVTLATLRMMNFYGYMFSPREVTIKRIKEIYRKEEGNVIGLYSTHNYLRITRILNFLRAIDMKYLSSIFFLSMCSALKEDAALLKLVKQHGSLNYWIRTQDFLQNRIRELNLKRGQTLPPKLSEFKQENANSSDVKYSFSEAKGPVLPRYENNSCYMDSVIVALFAVPNDFLEREILQKNIARITNGKKLVQCSKNLQDDIRIRIEIRKEIGNLIATMRNKARGRDTNTCTNLRRLIKNCGKNTFDTSDMQDAGEFLQILFMIFDVKGLVRLRETYVTNDLVSTDINTMKKTFIDESFDVPIVAVSSFQLENKKEINIRKFLRTIEDTTFDKNNYYKNNGVQYSRRIELNLVSNAEFLIFYIQRLQTKGKKIIRNLTRILIEPTLKLEQAIHDLYAIVVHSHQHYTCFIKSKNNWYHYDDNPGGGNAKLSLVGTFESLINNENNVRVYGNLFFYRKRREHSMGTR